MNAAAVKTIAAAMTKIAFGNEATVLEYATPKMMGYVRKMKESEREADGGEEGGTHPEDHLAHGLEDRERAERLACVRLAARLHDAQRKRVNRGHKPSTEGAHRGRANEQRLPVCRACCWRGERDEEVRAEVDEERAADERHIEPHLARHLGGLGLGSRGRRGGCRLRLRLRLERGDDD